MFLIDFKGGKVLYNDLDKDSLYLKEDLLQVEYLKKESTSVVIDLGWYGNEEGEGVFKIFVLINYDWDNPFTIIDFNTIKDLNYHLGKAIEIALQLSLYR